MDRDDLRLDRADLARLRDAVRRAQRGGSSIQREDVLAVHAASPRDASLTVDFEAAEQLGMPMVVVRLPAERGPSPVLSSLTARELEVAGLVAAGLANKEIADRLGLRMSTVKEHVHRILAKTELPSRAAVARAYAGGWETGPGRTAEESDGTRHGGER